MIYLIIAWIALVVQVLAFIINGIATFTKEKLSDRVGCFIITLFITGNIITITHFALKLI